MSWTTYTEPEAYAPARMIIRHNLNLLERDLADMRKFVEEEFEGDDFDSKAIKLRALERIFDMECKLEQAYVDAENLN